ncbi:MAG: hypothetical protein P8Y81_08150 [Ignavibacteriaceae bacterium]|jgi:hypothetical protein
MNNTTEQMQKKERLVTKIIVAISIMIGILLTLVFTGLLDFLK